jgi:hypothetical protein
MIDSNPLNHLGSGAKSNGLPAGKWMLKQRSLLVLCAFALLAGSAGRCRAQAAPAPVYNPTNPIPTEAKQLPSVSVAPDHRVTFRIRAPQTNTVTLNGDFLLGSPAVNLTKDAEGRCRYVMLAEGLAGTNFSGACLVCALRLVAVPAILATR